MKGFLLAGAIILIDQLSKYLIKSYFPNLIVVNKGIAFGWFPSKFWFFICAILLVFIFRSEKKKDLAISLIIGGGLANLIDRYLYKGVIDFINLKIWPVFNLADLAIVLGFFLTF